MTVRELIEELEKRDPEKPVQVAGCGGITDVTEWENGKVIALLGEYDT